ncbi:hypothetical protein TCAL_12268 [Tigriopus californicus]|uniref:Uncharacterized protein n=1 Tax=Tigriopus californicus TaxID=6832 RepID=A0A553N8K6_TIGCA|nr:uncharacterized protein LOC131884407 [Tigriopus californicus]TRY61774.1 hypothetical protein TCAL_12268 [Tigriopus californicus]
MDSRLGPALNGGGSRTWSQSSQSSGLEGEEDQNYSGLGMSGTGGTRGPMSPMNVGRKRITAFIADRPLRLKSYTRRRHVPFKRLSEMDITCATQSLLIQFCPDFDELLYYGPTVLVQKFLSVSGLVLSDVQPALDSLQSANETLIPAPDATPVKPLKAKKPGLLDMDDDDYSPTVYERKQKEKIRRKERMEREKKLKQTLAEETVPSGTVLDVNKSFRSRKESLMAKIKETDNVCGCQSFLLILAPDKDACYYYGHPAFVSLFFSTGIAKGNFHTRVNVREFEVEELDYTLCSVPHCIVSRNSLNRWRLAAQELYNFPKSLPMNLHICPEEDRSRWMAELDLDPSNLTGKIAVCSLHFKDGYPSDANPLPSRFLQEALNFQEPQYFGGIKPHTNDSEENSSLKLVKLPSVIKDVPYSQLVLKTGKRRKGMWRRSFFKVRFGLPLHERKAFKLVQRARKDRLGSLIRLRKTGKLFRSTKSYFNFVRKRLIDAQILEQRPDESTMETSVKLKNEEPDLDTDDGPVELTEDEKLKCLYQLYPRSEVSTMNARKKYVCSVCQSVCDLFGLFTHMKQVHKGLLCQYCLKLFKRVPDLEQHLKNMHNLRHRFFHSTKEFTNICGSNYSLVCGSCSQMVPYTHLENHGCNKSKKRSFDCPFCDRSFSFQNQLEMHLCNGWCKGMPWLGNPSRKDTRALYKTLTGLDLDKTFQSSLPKPKMLAPSKEESKKTDTLFNVTDRQILAKYSRNNVTKSSLEASLIEGLPESGSIFCGMASRGVNNLVRKEINVSGFSYNLQGKLKELNIKPSKALEELQITMAGKKFVIEKPQPPKLKKLATPNTPSSSPPITLSVVPPLKLSVRRQTVTPIDQQETPESVVQSKDYPVESSTRENSAVPPLTKKVAQEPVKKENKTDRINRVATEIQANWDKIREVMDMFKASCLFCEQAQYISLDTVFILSHLMIVHDRSKVEEVFEESPEFCISRVKKQVRDCRIREIIFNYNLSDDLSELITYRCTYCSSRHFPTYDGLLAHVAADHSSKMLACHLCTNVFMNYGSYLSHICGGPPHGSQQTPKAKFNCRFCFKPDMGNFLDFQFHLRKNHVVCEICMKVMSDQQALLNHCLTHAQELMCTKCFLTYDTLLEFRKHLYLKHEQEHKVCKQCHQKTWPHVYHFCVKPTGSKICEVCEQTFDNFKAYRVHIRSHTGAKPYLCSATDCSKSYISRQLLWKHQIRRHPDLESSASKGLQDKRQKRILTKFDATSMESIDICQLLLKELVEDIFPKPIEPNEGDEDGRNESENKEDKENMDTSDQTSSPGGGNENSKDPNPPRDKEFDAIDAAVRSIIGPEGSFDITKSPIKSPPPMIPASDPSPVAGIARSSLPLPINPHFHHPTQPQSPLLVRTSANASSPVLIRPQHISSNLPSALSPSSSATGIIPNVRMGQVMPTPASINTPNMPGYAPRAPKSNVRLPNIRPHHLFAKPSPPQAPSEILPPNAKILEPNPPRDTHDASSSDPEVTPVKKQPVVSGIWNQDLMFIGEAPPPPIEPNLNNKQKKIKTLNPTLAKSWDVILSESSDESGGEKPRKPRIVERTPVDRRISLRDHDYCPEVFAMVNEPVEDLSEMDKLLSQVAMGPNIVSAEKEKKRKKKKKKRKKKKHKKKEASNEGSSSSSDSENDTLDVGSKANLANGYGISTPQSIMARRGSGPKPVYHTPGASTGVTAGAARPYFTSSSEDEADSEDEAGPVGSSDEEPRSSDLDTDFEAEELLANLKQIQQKGRRSKPSAKAALNKGSNSTPASQSTPATPSLKLKIKLPPKPPSPVKLSTFSNTASNPVQQRPKARMINTSLNRKKAQQLKLTSKPPVIKAPKRKRASFGTTLHGQPMSKKMRESLLLNQVSSSSSSAAEESEEESNLVIDHDEPQPAPVAPVAPPPTSRAQAAAPPDSYASIDDKLYCVCQSPHDDVSEMIGCDAPDCRLEWFHFECVGILVPPEGQWYCPECSQRYKIRA